MTKKHPTIRRNCFVCGSDGGDIHLHETWDIVGFGKITKGLRACDNCGLVLQDPAVPPEVMLSYYASFSNYTNPSRQGMPTERKQLSVANQVKTTQAYIREPGTAFQVGCSDGFTLSRFREAGWQVAGCDPSSTAHEVAKRIWGINTHIANFEVYAPKPDEKYDLIIMTHVLEHIYEPVEALRKVRGMLTEGGALLMEVPLLTDLEYLPEEGYFTMEHINFFSHKSLLNTLALAGFEAMGPIEDDYDVDPQYPITRLMAAPTDKAPQIAKEAGWASNLMAAYAANEDKAWQSLVDGAFGQLGDRKDVIIWGAGIHTSQLFAKTNLLDTVNIKGVVDSDPQKWGQTIAGQTVISPDEFWNSLSNVPVVISTRASEYEVSNSLMDKGLDEANVVTLYSDEKYGIVN